MHKDERKRSKMENPRASKPSRHGFSCRARSLAHATGRLATAGLALALLGASPALANAVYNPMIGVPECSTPSPSCSSGDLLKRSGHMSPPEANQPNTMHVCQDGSKNDSYQSDESIERIVVGSADGQDMVSGGTVWIEVSFFAYDDSNILQLSVTGDGENPLAAFETLPAIQSLRSGWQSHAVQYTLPEGGLQRVRARLGDGDATCDGNGYYDVDELVFAVAGPPSPILDNAVYDSTLGAPRCAETGASCDSGGLLRRSGHMSPPEANQPNTVGGACQDGSESLKHWKDESIERIVVSTVDGQEMVSGARVRVDVTFFPYGSGSGDRLLISYTGDGNNPAATFETLPTYQPTQGGLQTYSVEYTLPEGPVQRVRARLADQNYLSRCDGYGYYDVDELVFALASWKSPWTTVTRSQPIFCGGWQDFVGDVVFDSPQVPPGEILSQHSPGVLAAGSYQWGGSQCGGYCTVDPLDPTNAGCAHGRENAMTNDEVRSLLSSYFTPGFDASSERPFYEALFAHAMGESFHAPAGAAISLSRTVMTSRLLERLDPDALFIDRIPTRQDSSAMEGRPAAFLFTRDEVDIQLDPDAGGSASIDAHYLEQLGHYLNFARCKLAGAAIDQREACATAQGGSAGARFRDALVAMGDSRDLGELNNLLPTLHPRLQLASFTERYDLGENVTMLLATDPDLSFGPDSDGDGIGDYADPDDDDDGIEDELEHPLCVYDPALDCADPFPCAP